MGRVKALHCLSAAFRYGGRYIHIADNMRGVNRLSPKRLVEFAYNLV